MRHHQRSSDSDQQHTHGNQPARGDWQTIKMLLPYLWEYRWRAGIAMSFLVAAKLANIRLPAVQQPAEDAEQASAPPDAALEPREEQDE